MSPRGDRLQSWLVPSGSRAHLTPLGLLRAAYHNPLEAWTTAHFERPIVVNQLPFGQVVVVSEPSGIRRALLENPQRD